MNVCVCVWVCVCLCLSMLISVFLCAIQLILAFRKSCLRLRRATNWLDACYCCCYLLSFYSCLRVDTFYDLHDFFPCCFCCCCYCVRYLDCGRSCLIYSYTHTHNFSYYLWIKMEFSTFFSEFERTFCDKKKMPALHDLHNSNQYKCLQIWLQCQLSHSFSLWELFNLIQVVCFCSCFFYSDASKPSRIVSSF